MPAHIHVCPCGLADRNITKFRLHVNSRSCDFTMNDMKRPTVEAYKEQKRAKLVAKTSLICVTGPSTDRLSELIHEVSQLKDIISVLVGKIELLSSEKDHRASIKKSKVLPQGRTNNCKADTDPHITVCMAVLRDLSTDSKLNLFDCDNPRLAPVHFYKAVYATPVLAMVLNGLTNTEKINKCLKDFTTCCSTAKTISVRVLGYVIHTVYFNEQNLCGERIQKMKIPGVSQQDAKPVLAGLGKRYVSSCFTKEKIVSAFDSSILI